MKPSKRNKTPKDRDSSCRRSAGTHIAARDSVKLAGPSYSMYSTSTESSDQVQSAHNDLDRCTHVLNEILDNDHGLLDAITKRAKRTISTRRAPSKVPFKKQGNARSTCIRGKLRNAWSSTPQNKPAAVSTASGSQGRLRHKLLPDGDARESPGRDGRANISAIDAPEHRIRLLRNNEARRALDDWKIPSDGAAGSAASHFNALPSAAKKAATDLKPPEVDDVPPFDRCSSNAASEADTLRGAHLENSSQFGIPPVFSATSGFLLNKAGRTTDKIQHELNVNKPVVESIPAKWDAFSCSKKKRSLVGHESAPLSGASLHHSGGVVSSPRVQKASEPPRVNKLDQLHDSGSSLCNEDTDTTLVTSKLDVGAAAGQPEMRLSPSVEACRFRLRYLVHEIAVAANTADLRRLVAEMKKTVDTMLSINEQPLQDEESAVLSENLRLKNRVKLLELRMENARAKADDEAEMTTTAYQVQVSKLEALASQLERTIFEERRLLQQAKEELSEQQKLVADLRCERAEMMRALALKDGCYTRLKQQRSDSENEFHVRCAGLQCQVQQLELRLQECSSQLHHSRRVAEQLASDSCTAYELLCKLTENLDNMTIDDSCKSLLQAQMADARSVLLHSAIQKHDLLATPGATEARQAVDRAAEPRPPAHVRMPLNKQPADLPAPAPAENLQARPRSRIVKEPVPSSTTSSRMSANFAVTDATQLFSKKLEEKEELTCQGPSSCDPTAISEHPGTGDSSSQCFGTRQRPKQLSINDAIHDPRHASAVVTAAGRYSVTDYFRKYHPSSSPGFCGRYATGKVKSVPSYSVHPVVVSPEKDTLWHEEDIPREPIRAVVCNPEDARGELHESTCLELSSSSNTTEDPVALIAGKMHTRSQYESFAGTALDTSQSTIADHESNVSASHSTTTSVADSAFKQGLELLDANIARLQHELQSSLKK